MANGMSTRSDSPNRSDKILFWASFLTLIAAGIGFAVRGTSVLKSWGDQFGFTQTELGGITGGGLAGFGITIIVLSFIADKVGYGRLMGLAFFLHVSSAVVTLAATPVFNAYGKEAAYWCLNIGMWLFALGNGTCEAVINPLTATLFPKEKTRWLNILHAGWPLGLILGALLGLGFKAIGNIGWEWQIAMFLVPTFAYGIMMLGRNFPVSDVERSGVPFGEMVITLFSPILLFLFGLHALVGYVELGTDSWITNITSKILSSESYATGLFIWTSGLMFVLRFCAGPIVHKISPIGLLFVSACLGSVGLVLLSKADTLMMAIAAATIYGVGKTFLWPTMLGVVSEQYPRAGALALGMAGGIGMLSAGFLGGPGIGYKQDYFATEFIQKEDPAAFERYRSPTENGFLEFTGLLPKVAGLDNSKVAVLLDNASTLQSDIEILKSSESRDPNVKNNLMETETWWQEQGEPNAKSDKPQIAASQLFGSRMALLYTAAVPAAMAVGYLLLLIYYMLTGGYKPKHV